MFCETFFTLGLTDGIFHIILSIPQNTIMCMNNVMNDIDRPNRKL